MALAKRKTNRTSIMAQTPKQIAARKNNYCLFIVGGMRNSITRVQTYLSIIPTASSLETEQQVRSKLAVIAIMLEDIDILIREANNCKLKEGVCDDDFY